MSLKNLGLKAKVILASGIPSLLILVLGVVASVSIYSLLDSSHWVDHTHEVMKQAQRIEGAAVDMETGMRGYLLAGKEEFLDPYNKGGKRFEKLVGELRNTVSDNPAQVKLLDETLENITAWKSDVTDPAIKLRREIGDSKSMHDMAKLVGEARGKKYFDKFREQIATFREREMILIRQRKAEAEKAIAFVEHTHHVIEKGQNLEGAAVDMETGMRGFLLAGKEAFLEPYNSGRDRFRSIVSDLKVTVRDNPAQVALLDEIDKNISEWQRNVTEPAIATRRQVGKGQTMKAIAKMVGEARGKRYFDKFRGQIKTFIDREQVLIKERLKISADARAFIEHTHKVIREGMFIEAAAVDMETGMRGYLLAGKEEFLEPYKAGRTNFNTRLRELKVTVSDNPPQVALLEDIQANINEWQTEVTEPSIALRRTIGDSKSMDDIADLVGEKRGKSYFDKFRGQIATFIEREQALMVERQKTADNQATTTTTTLALGILLTLVVTVTVSWFVIQAIVRPVARALGLTKEISEGNLTRRINLDQDDEIGILSRALDTMTDGLDKNMSKISSSAGLVADQSSQLAATSRALSEGSTQQASALSETSSSMTEMASQTKTSAENASEANKLAEAAHSSAKKGGEQIETMVAAMKKINHSSSEISKIIKVIDDIAFQTNLLALNAAVEAARAGKHGKGFAVVAEEVRNLAARSAKAAKETGELIESSVKEVESGTEIANRSAEAFEEIVGSIARTSSLVSEIAAASNEQARGIAQANEGLRQIDRVTKENTVGSQQTAQAAELLMKQARFLQEILARFELNNGEAGAAHQDAKVIQLPQGAPAAPAPSHAPAQSVATATSGSSALSPMENPESVISLDDKDFGRY